MDILDMILTIVYIIVGAALVWFIVELALTIKSVRSTVADIKKDIQPTIDSANRITSDIEPIVKKVDPLMDHVNLTVDAANLEIMRLDGILENVSSITGAVSKTVTAVDNVTSAPLDIVTTMTKKMRDRFRPKYASQESIDMGESDDSSNTNPIADFVSEAASAAGEAIDDHKEQVARQKRAASEKEASDDAKRQKMGVTSTKIVDGVLDQTNADTDPDNN